MSNISIHFGSKCDLWEFVLSFEDGSLPRASWNERTIAAVAVWYLSIHPMHEAVARLEAAVQRNRRRFRRRAADLSDRVTDMAALWPRILQQVLAASEREPLAMANDLLSGGGGEVPARAA